MTKELTAELFSVATRRTPEFERFQRSLSRFRIPLTILGESEPEYWGHGWRWKTFIRAARASSAQIVLQCDGYDTLCLGALDEIISKFKVLAKPIVFSFEPTAEEGFSLGLNPGLMAAEREVLLSIFNDAILEEFFPDHFNDQLQLQGIYGREPNLFMLDRDSIVFQTLVPRSAELLVKNDRLVNPETGSAPCFVHGPHGWDLSGIEAQLQTLNQRPQNLSLSTGTF